MSLRSILFPYTTLRQRYNRYKAASLIENEEDKKTAIKTATGEIDRRKYSHRVLTDEQENNIEQHLRQLNQNKENIISISDAKAAMLEEYGKSPDPAHHTRQQHPNLHYKASQSSITRFKRDHHFSSVRPRTKKKSTHQLTDRGREDRMKKRYMNTLMNYQHYYNNMDHLWC